MFLNKHTDSRLQHTTIHFLYSIVWWTFFFPRPSDQIIIVILFFFFTFIALLLFIWVCNLSVFTNNTNVALEYLTKW